MATKVTGLAWTTLSVGDSSNATPILVCNCVLSDYALTRSAAGDLTFQVKGDLADGALPTWA